ncbi:hypothetical protein U14_03681 [Candidatus Moduliflexus flocculans]|uniref:Uncharacterized protein n=1 Tax=Candidatus Moduliflexus flocculans TaxID=1499966 RepID=A0A081BPW4_9BACT|nr:hypothetical protein U14_03681 [Candidatus Moduliflexus flocculans]
MEAYKFETTVEENGVIRIPEIARFALRNVEIFLVFESTEHPPEMERERRVEQFLDKWTGILKGSDPDEAKHDYLRGKYT